MRAVLLRHGELTVGDTPDPVPGPGELLLRTLSTAICASDVHFMDHPALADDPHRPDSVRCRARYRARS